LGDIHNIDAGGFNLKSIHQPDSREIELSIPDHLRSGKKRLIWNDFNIHTVFLIDAHLFSHVITGKLGIGNPVWEKGNFTPARF